MFNVKMYFILKSQFIAGGYRTDSPMLVPYSYGVPRGSSSLGFLVMLINGVEIMHIIW